MSQSHNPTDSQGLLQSMLQRLKLQSGREGQPFLHTSVPITSVSTPEQDGERGTSNLQKVKNIPVNGFELSTNGIPSKESGISAADSNFGLKTEEIQQPGHVCEMDRGLISFPSQEDNTDNDTCENRVFGQATSPGITPVKTGQLFPAKSLKDADITSFERTDGDRVSFGSSAMTRHIPGNNNSVPSLGQNQVQYQGFTPRVYMWSVNATDANLDTGSRENKMLHEGNGGFGALAQSKDVQFPAGSQKTTNSSSRRKQRSSENKMRWTQKIKARWLDRSGSFDKKGKEGGGRVDQKSEQGTETQVLRAENLINTSTQEEERTLLSLDSSDPSEPPPTHTADSTLEGCIRSSNDFEFGLGSFSLLEEIVTGQKWARFLNPNLPATSTNQSPPEEPLHHLKIPSNPHSSSQSSLILNQQGGGNNPWSFRGTASSPVSDFRTAQISSDAFLSVSMDVSEGKQQQHVHTAADLSEPMEDWQSGKRGQGQQCRPPSFVEPAYILNTSALKRVYLNRKRHHQSAERGDEKLQTEKISDGRATGREGSISSLGITSNHVMDETGESKHDIFIPLYTLNSSSTPLSPSSFNPFVPAPRGVLRHSISQDSESSMETVTKRRRVEENRRVRFSEEVVTIASPELDVDVTDSEGDSGAEKDSVIEQECEVEQAATEEVAPARRTALPAWIQALKRRNMGRKHR
ncbi:uncharacterized protein zgc:113229 isoform X2 [Xiphias gladius]|uniref:uncharacterized protein zgc:113229 isoform X2 n=1 Tax=Xiphias gladius TaxID=8245 RepID=UPI001A992244|nr:uncharacterized protein zgc:113229 isoform X2 [Xiphias gladius]